MKSCDQVLGLLLELVTIKLHVHHMSEGLLETYGKGAGPHNQFTSGAVDPAVIKSGHPTGNGGRSLHHCSVPLTDSSFSKQVSKSRPFLPKDVVQLCCSIPM